MSYQVFYTPRSQETLRLVYDFINGKFGKRAADKFLAKTGKVIELIAEQPQMFKASIFNDDVRVALITKQTSMFYKITDTSVYLLFFWDNRQDPMIL
ncbi:type II toxin-antitoxin system RelE/ParE family toxin [Pedobacter sp. HMF7647]|uniref:Type II toxin-antitoxin system RelE/ParE family toxin n=1 Tax=Hufsiella arboris TaxID=2695275 RepID=A0A7K1YEG9_9SPHI|nr:type II toxin-antitoxin system RelE/ParE family toxin [Hufsiella arboris]MXV52428.1 type II toxin-antitoxin system RelE/ParE family toxin [Hufsiella arboris]